MHPFLADRRQLGLYLIGYLPIGLVLVLGFGQRGAWSSAAVFFLPLTMIYAFIGLSAYYVCSAFPISRNYRIWRAVPAHISSAATVGGVCVGIAWVWSAALQSLNLGFQTAPYMAQPWQLFVIAALLFWLAIAFHYVLIGSYAAQKSEKRALEAELLARDAELKALRAQLDPHFLFNSLNSISSLTGSDPAAARKMCLLLADFLRDTLRFGGTHRIALKDELGVVQRYLAIEQVRLGPRLNLLVQASEAAMATLIPPLILQPLVENAVLHGIAHLLDGGTVAIHAQLDQSTLRIIVSNPVDADRPRNRRTGFGLMLIRERLLSQYAGTAQLTVVEENGVYSAEVSVPFE